MTKRKKTYRRHPSRLDRIEHKCDRILAELIIMRQRRTTSSSTMDDALERIHGVARKMRRQCEIEYGLVRDLIESGR